MKTIARAIAIVTVTATIAACAGQSGYTSQREYRNPFLKARHIGTAQASCSEGDQSCMAQQSAK